METLPITVITPSVRPELLVIVAQCLAQQTFKDFQWLIGAPSKLAIPVMEKVDDIWGYEFVVEPKKKDGDYYNLNKAWNKLFKRAKGELIVNIVDGLWFPPDLLERLWTHYQLNPKACISCIGHQYTDFDKPAVWRDPRARIDLGSFYEVSHSEMEFCIASFAKQAVVDVGGIDEKFDRFAALSEKEMMSRIYKAGYKLYLAQDIEYKAIKHDRLSKDWDSRFYAGIDYYNECMQKINSGQRLKLGFL